MSGAKMLGITQGVHALSIHSSPWCLGFRNISNKNLLEKLGLPEKPKKPLTPYLMFLQNARHDILSKNPGASVKEVSHMGSKLWKEMSPSEKAKLSEQFRKDYEKYKAELKKYEKSLTAEQKAEIREAEAEIKAIKEQKLMKQLKSRREKELNKPKFPKNTFMKFVFSVDKGHDTYQVHLKKMSEKWSKISESARQKLQAEFERDHEQYKKDLELWEEEMIRQGHIDVVRSKTLKNKLKVYS